MGTEKRGFASIDPERRREIARKVGLSVSQNRERMAEIGRKGGKSSGVSRSKKEGGV